MTWFYLALLAPFLYAIVNLIDDNLLRNVYRSPHVGTIISGLFGGLPLLSLFFLDAEPISLRYQILSLIVGVLITAYLYFYFLALDRESPSIVVALLGVSPVIIGAFAFLVQGERLQASEIVGLGLVLAASTGLALGGGKEKTHFSKSLTPILFGALSICAYSLIAKDVYDHVPFYTAYMWVSAGMMIGGLYFLLVLFHSPSRYRLTELRKSFRKFFLLFLVTELLGIAAEFTTNLAISKGSVTIISALEGIQPIYVLLISLALFPFHAHLFREASEGGLKVKISLMLVIIVGLYLVTGV